MLNDEEKSVIRTEWRDGKYKNLARLEKLSQLHACDVATVCEAVGIDPKKYKGATSSRRIVRSYDQAVKDDVVKAVLVEGMAYKDAAEKFGVPKGNVSLWIKRAKENQARVIELAPPPAAAESTREEARRKTLAEQVMAELQAGIDGLHAFIDNFAGVDILSDDERDVLERVLNTSSGFTAGIKTGFVLASRNSSEI